MAQVRHYKEYTKAQQDVYEQLNEQARDYIELRRQGLTRADAYRSAFRYTGNNARQCAYNLEKRFPEIIDLVEVLHHAKMVDELRQAKDGELKNLIDAKAKQQDVEEVLKAIDEADGETARRIQFYKAIIDGEIKSVKVTTKRDEKGRVLYTQTVENDDVAVRMQAREKLDRILGLNHIVTLDQVNCGDITINIVDATKKEPLPKKEDENIIDVTEEDLESGDDE